MADDRPAVERIQPPDALWTYAVNPVVKLVLRTLGGSRIGDRLMLLHYRGRRTGKSYELPVGHHDANGRMVVLTTSGWRANFRGGHECEVTLKGVRRPAHATLVEEPEEVAKVYRTLIGRIGPSKAQRQLGLRVNIDRVPTHDELARAAEREGLSVLEVEVDPAV